MASWPRSGWGADVIIEQDHRPVAVITPAKPAGRMVSAVIADLKARRSDAAVDFARVEERIKAQRHSWSPPSRK